MKQATFLFIPLLILSCTKSSDRTDKDTEPEAISLFGQPLYPRKLSPEVEKDFKRKLADTRMQAKAHPENEITLIWYGRRLAYMGHFNKAIEVYSQALTIHPESYKLLRHRGHRYISIREFDRAVADLSRAAVLSDGTEPEIEPDGLPNKMNIPLTTTQWNIYYHLGLAYYLNGDFEKALDAYQVCYALSDNPDVLVAITDWMYMTYRRLGMIEEADELLTHIGTDLEIIENDSYIKRNLMYKGLIPPDSLLQTRIDNSDQALSLATQGYGVGNWYLYNGDTMRTKAIYEQVLKGDYWSAFGYIAAEADMYRLR